MAISTRNRRACRCILSDADGFSHYLGVFVDHERSAQAGDYDGGLGWSRIFRAAFYVFEGLLALILAEIVARSDPDK